MNDHQDKSNFSKTIYCFIPIILYFGISFIVQLIYEGVVIFSLWQQNPNMQYTETLNKVMNYLTAANTQLMLIIAVITIIIAGIMFFKNEYKRFDRKFQNKIGFKGIVGTVTISVGFYMFVQICFIIAVSLLDMNDMLEEYNKVIGILLSGNTLLSILTIGILTPIAEEIIFRGLAFNRMRTIMKERTAIILSAILFAFMHGNAIQMSYALFLGLILAYAYSKYENILVPIFIHMIFNLINFAVTDQLMSDILSTMQGSLLFYIVCIVLTYIGVRIFVKKTKPSLRL